MKPLILHFAGLSALLAVIEANELPPQSIPVQCATICGPIVELTALCSKKRSVPLNKPRLKRHMEQPRALEPLPYLQRDTYKHKRVFVTLVPPPPAVSVPQSQQPTPQPASHPPPVSQSPKQPPPPPASPPPPSPPVSQTTQQKPPPPPPQPAPPEPPAQTSQASKPKEKGPVEQSTSSARASRSGGTETAAMSPVPSMKGGTSMSGMVEGSGGSSPEMDSSKGPESNEEICVCENRSFDVATLTGLCASCVASKSKLHDAANLELIMSTCDFPEQRYSPDKDKLVNNIVVKAVTSGVAYNSTTSGGYSAQFPTRYSLAPIMGTMFLAALWPF